MPRAVIITSYVESPLDINELLRYDDYVMCLDGGYDIALSQDITPDAILGDFDSVRAPLPSSNDIRIMEYPPEKDFTDLELALMNIDAEAFPEVLIIGGIGGRLDQTAINIQLINRFSGPAGRFKKIEMLDGSNRCFVLHAGIPTPGEEGSVDIPADPGSFLSLIPLTVTCGGVTLTGVKYPLEKATLSSGSSLSVSNEFEGWASTIRVESGSLLVVISKER